MNQAEAEGERLRAPEAAQRIRFLAALARNLIVVGRGSYRPETEGLDRPRDLRVVNEIQHRVTACLSADLTGGASLEFVRAIGPIVLEQADQNLADPLRWAWQDAQRRLGENKAAA